MADNTEEPGVVALEITPTDAEFTNTGDMRLIITGVAPHASVDVEIAVSPSSGSLALNELSPDRGYGLQLTGAAPDRLLSESVAPSVGSLAITGKTSTLITEPPDAVAPEGDELRLVGPAPSINLDAGLPVGSLTLTGPAPSLGINHAVLIGIDPLDPDDENFQELFISTGGITVDLSSELAVIGTTIENTQATEYDGRYNICDRTGFRAKPGQLVEDGYGNMVLPEFRDSRHPQEFIRSRAETHTGPKRPEPVGDELDVDEEYPSGVTADDL